MSFKSGFVGIIGKPNAGKSTLLNSLVNSKVAITTYKASTTRNIIKGILTTNEYQIVFLDTPGIQKAKDSLGREMNKNAYNTMHSVDLIYYIVDGSKPITRSDYFIVSSLKNNKDIPVILLVNKLDLVKMAERLKALEEWSKLMDFQHIIPISAKEGKNLDQVLQLTQQYLIEGEKFYDENTITDQPDKFYISEVIREHALLELDQEVPHSLAIFVENIEYKKEVNYIQAVMCVERESQKGIVIGKNGDRLKRISSASRIDLENSFNKKIFLEIFVRVQENWRNRPDKLKELINNYNE